MYDLAKAWLEECDQNHPFCTISKPSFNPTRLAHIVDETLVRIVLSQERNDHHSYATLSHCWGKAKTLKLLRANMQVLRYGILVQDLPTSYKEAISVCRALNISYIWIDSLCIIQDDKDDWTREASMMQDVYENSMLNICAYAAAENSQASFQGRDSSLILPLEVDFPPTDSQRRKYQLICSDILQRDIKTSPLASRAWVLQEQGLSKCSLGLTQSQLWWECRQKLACETYPLGFPLHLFNKSQAEKLKARSETNPCSQVPLSSLDTYDIDQGGPSWYKIIEEYTRRHLTQPMDKLIACSGLAQNYRDENRLHDDDYVAGVWISQLPHALCWTTPKYKWTYRPQMYRAPSWSWASIEGYDDFSIFKKDWEEWDGFIGQPLCEITDITLHYVQEHYKTGPLKGGCIRIRGQIIGPATNHFEYPEGDDEVQQALTTAGWAFDETSASGGPSISYLEQLPSDFCHDEHVEAANRKTVEVWGRKKGRVTVDYPETLEMLEETIQLFIFPIIDRTKKTNNSVIRSMKGLILGQVLNQPQNVFQRMGFFTNLEMSDDVLRRASSEVLFTLI
jgi:hypothetical protein